MDQSTSGAWSECDGRANVVIMDMCEHDISPVERCLYYICWPLFHCRNLGVFSSAPVHQDDSRFTMYMFYCKGATTFCRFQELSLPPSAAIFRVKFLLLGHYLRLGGT